MFTYPRDLTNNYPRACNRLEKLRLEIKAAQQEVEHWQKEMEKISFINSTLTAAEQAMAKNPNGLIAAIKEVRNRTGLPLKEAKDLVDQYRAQNGIDSVAR